MKYIVMRHYVSQGTFTFPELKKWCLDNFPPEYKEEIEKCRYAYRERFDRKSLSELSSRIEYCVIKPANPKPHNPNLVKAWLHKIKLNNQGYDRNGSYYGTGLPLYTCNYEIGGNYLTFEFRAVDKAAAKEYAKLYIKTRYANAEFK